MMSYCCSSHGVKRTHNQIKFFREKRVIFRSENVIDENGRKNFFRKKVVKFLLVINEAKLN